MFSTAHAILPTQLPCAAFTWLSSTCLAYFLHALPHMSCFILLHLAPCPHYICCYPFHFHSPYLKPRFWTLYAGLHEDCIYLVLNSPRSPLCLSSPSVLVPIPRISSLTDCSSSFLISTPLPLCSALTTIYPTRPTLCIFCSISTC